MESDRPTVIPSTWTGVSHEHEMFERLREITQAFHRVAILDATGSVIASSGEEPPCPALFDGVLGARPNLVTVSGSRGTSTLVALADGSFLWCEFPASVLVGEVFAAMAVLEPATTITPSPPSVREPSPSAGKRSGNGRTEAVLERELQDPNVEGAFAIDRELRRMHFASRDTATSAVAMELVKRGGEIASEWIEGADTRPLRVFAQRRLTLFGIANGKPRSTWLAFSAPVPRGVGFAAVERLAASLDRERESTTLSFGAVRVNK